jgi:ABC-type dipeptide/oligopeptide/nickel transport system permease subunit
MLSDHVPDDNRPADEPEVPAPAGAAPITLRQALPFGWPLWLRSLLMDRKAAVGLAILSFFILVGIVGPLIWPGDPMASDYTALPQQPPSAAHWFGTDQQGHDIFL